jgi:hypothetical protein
VLDGAVLAGCVHCLEHKQQRPLILGVEHVLLLREPLGTALQEVGRLGLVQPQTTRVARIEVVESETLAFSDTERINIFLDAIEDLFSRHGASSFSRSPV